MDKDVLKRETDIELENLDRLSREMEELTKRFLNKPDFVEIRAAASILHDFYCGIEKIFERIAIHIDGGVPKGEDWHAELLLQMKHSIEGIRETVISQKLMEKLKEYLRFRHLFRYIYGFELKWERFKGLALSLNVILSELKRDLEKFFK